MMVLMLLLDFDILQAEGMQQQYRHSCNSLAVESIQFTITGSGIPGHEAGPSFQDYQIHFLQCWLTRWIVWCPPISNC